VLGYIVLDELHQHISHIQALGGRDCLEVIVELDGNVQIHSLHLWLFDFLDLAHLLSEVSLSGYEYRALLQPPGLPAQQDDLGHRDPLDIQSIRDRPELLPGGRKRGAGFDRLPLRSTKTG